MGTNYYIVTECKCCGNVNRELHIGKSSAGWVFLLRLHPADDIWSLYDWVLILKKGSIRDEYGHKILPENMLYIITNRKWTKEREVPHPHKSWDEFHASNHSENGPNGLIRPKKGDRCLSHGDGTWSYIIGEFS